MQGSIPQLGVSDKPLRRTGALAVCILFVLITALAVRFNKTQLIELRTFLPICATLWAAAQLVTAFLLLSQFYVQGKLSYALLAAAFAFTALLTIPYLFEFPGLFPIPNFSAGRQISICLWAFWHICLPLCIGTIFEIDPTLERRTVSRAKIVPILWAVCLGAVGGAALTSAAVIFNENRLPVLTDGFGHFSPLYRGYVLPAMIYCCIGSSLLVSLRLKKATPLQLWIGVALFISGLDSTLSAATGARYTIGWYISKLEALSAASVVLLMLLYQISSLYRRLYEVASVDSLTGLGNRRWLDIRLSAIFSARRAKARGAALLLLDLDQFKQYNDRYGHTAGDNVLRAIGEILRASIYRPGDVVARYGGEEFAVLLLDVEMQGARAVAERIRINVEASILRIGAVDTRITTSIGLAYLSPQSASSPDRLIKAADLALYAAKDEGRNCIRVNDSLRPVEERLQRAG